MQKCSLLCQACIHAHDLVICLIQQAADLAVPLQHVTWNLQLYQQPHASLILLCAGGMAGSLCVLHIKSVYCRLAWLAEFLVIPDKCCLMSDWPQKAETTSNGLGEYCVCSWRKSMDARAAVPLTQLLASGTDLETEKATCLLFADAADHHDLGGGLGGAGSGDILSSPAGAGIRATVLASYPQGLAV